MPIKETAARYGIVTVSGKSLIENLAADERWQQTGEGMISRTRLAIRHLLCTAVPQLALVCRCGLGAALATDQAGFISVQGPGLTALPCPAGDL